MTLILMEYTISEENNSFLNFLYSFWENFQTVTDESLLVDIVVMSIIAIILVPISKRLGLGSVLGYIFTGIIVGPSLLQVTHDIEGVRHFAEFGVVLLMFLIGLELQLSKLWALRGMVFGLGLSQILITGIAISGYFWFINKINPYIVQGQGFSFKEFLLSGLALALSSTAIALQTIQEEGEMNTEQGQASFSILLMQDIAAVPLLAITPLMANNTTGVTVGEPFYITLLKIAIIVGLMLLVTRVISPVLVPILQKSKVLELRFPVIFIIIFGSGWLMEEVGLSMTLGAFIAGLMLSDSEYRYNIEAELLERRDLLLGLFFIAVGMSIDFQLIREDALFLLRDAFAILVIKIGVVYGLCRFFQKTHPASVKSALLLSQSGEFCFVIAGICLSSGIYDDYIYRFILVTVALTMSATPLLILLANKLGLTKIEESEGKEEIKTVSLEEESADQIIIIGFGRMGETIANLLKKKNIAYWGLESNAERVKEASQQGYKVYFGDIITSKKILMSAGLTEAKAVIITVPNAEACDYILTEIRELCPDLPISCRAQNLEHSLKLQKLGATDIVLDTFEASLQLGRKALDYTQTESDEIEQLLESFREDNYTLAIQ